MPKKVNENLDFQNIAKATNHPAPTSAGDLVNKAYADAIPSGLKFIEAPVRAAATTNINVASPGATIDGVTLTNGDRVLLAGQTTATQNGTYIFNGAASALTRTTDQFITGSVVFSNGDGTSNGNIGWILTTDNPVVGSTSLTFVAAFRVISAGTGLSISGNVISLTSPVTVALGGTNATTAAAALTNLGAVRPFEADFGNGSSTSFTFTPTTLAKYPQVQIVNNSTGAVEDALVVITPGAQSGGVYTPSVVVSSEAWTASPPGSNAYHVTILG